MSATLTTAIIAAAAFAAGAYMQHRRVRRYRTRCTQLEKALAGAVLVGALQRKLLNQYRHHVRAAVSHGIMPAGSRQERN